MTNAISFITANYVAREVGWAMHGWGHGDKATNEAFAPLETFGERFGALLDDVRRLGFDTLDVWGAHLNVDWASDEHVALARTLIDERGLAVGSYQVWVGPQNLERACDIAAALGTSLLSGSVPLDDGRLGSLLAERELRFALENHPDEKTPADVLAKPENSRPVGRGVAADAFEYRTAIAHHVRENMDGGLFPFDEATVVPDFFCGRQHAYDYNLGDC